MQLSKFASTTFEVISLYRSSEGNLKTLNQKINSLIVTEKPILILGDFNFCHLEANFNCTRKFLQEKSFQQLINEPTHIEGHALDQAHMRDPDRKLLCTAVLQAKYYTDHKGLGVIIKKNYSNER